MKVMFSADGNTAFIRDGEQVPELQESWLLLYAKFLEGEGIDPTKVTYQLPSGRSAQVFDTGNGFNWRIKEEEASAPDWDDLPF